MIVDEMREILLEALYHYLLLHNICMLSDNYAYQLFVFSVILVNCNANIPSLFFYILIILSLNNCSLITLDQNSLNSLIAMAHGIHSVYPLRQI